MTNDEAGDPSAPMDGWMDGKAGEREGRNCGKIKLRQKQKGKCPKKATRGNYNRLSFQSGGGKGVYPTNRPEWQFEEYH